MNLTKLFNKNYFVQNLKKSKTLLGITILVVPILTVLVLINFYFTDSYNIDYEETTRIFNIVNILGMYIVPIAISQILFGYIFKRKSIDFIGSMPINRRSIFLTNIIGGILLILLIQALTFIASLVTLTILNNTIISIKMLIDAFVLGLVSYIFVFSATSIGMAISGNLITQIVVTLLVLFLVPFTADTLATFNNYEEIEFAQSGVRDFLVSTENFKDYTMPYNYFRTYIYENIMFTNSVIIKMLILSIIYMFVSYFLFKRRKMENTEEGISNTLTHFCIKGLTLVPMIAVVVVIEAPIKTMILLFAIIFVYYYIYDIFTNKKVKIKIEIPVFILTSVVLFITLYLARDLKENSVEEYAKADIKSIGIAELSNYYDRNNIYGLEEINYEITDEKIIDIFYSGLREIRDSEEYSNGDYIFVKINLKNGKEIFTDVYLERNVYNEILEKLSNNEGYINSLKKDLTIENTNDYSIIYDNKKLEGKEKEELINLINNTIKNNFKKQNLDNESYTYNVKIIDCFYYKNHKLYNLELPVNISNELEEYTMNLSNKITLETLEKVEKQKENKEEIYYNVKEYNPEENTYSYYDMIYDRNGKLLEFIKNTELKVNRENAYYELVIDISGENYYRYWFYTNAIEEFLEAIGGENVISNNEIFFENTDDGLVLKNTVIESNSAIVENTTRPVIENRVETNN